MPKLPKIFKILLSFLTLFLICVSFWAGKTYAADAVPPPGRVPCTDTKNPEFASDRPYQGSPCGDRPVSYFCGNSVVIDLGSVKVPYCDPGGGQLTECPASIHKDQKIDVDLTNVQLPILGNTQLTPNSQSTTDQMDDGTKVSNYVAWYLGGVNTKAEFSPSDPSTAQGASRIVDTSGPVQKLLPSIVQDAQRLGTLTTYTQPTSFLDDETDQNVKESSGHDQIVVCASKQYFGLLGKAIPHPCYNGSNSKASDIYRLSSWTNGALSFFTGGWNKRYPPLPWSDENGKPFASDILYQKAYNEWKGKSCQIITIPLVNKQLLVCIDNPLISNEYADLYQYVPLANTTDKKGNQMVTSTILDAPKATLENKTYEILHSPQLYLAHSLEDLTLVNLLKGTYRAREASASAAVPGGFPGVTTPEDVEDNSKDCRIIPSRSNPGDDATFGTPESHIEVDVHYDVTMIECSTPEYTCSGRKNNPNVNCSWKATCQSTVYATVPSISKTGYADEIWASAVAGSDSVFRRIYPKTGANTPVSCIADTPAASNATYTLNKASSPGLQLVRVIEPDDSSVKGSGGQQGSPSIDAQLYYPHFGGVLDYFLNGIQTALRPKGYGEGPVTNGQYCGNIACGDLPKGLPKASGSCSLGGISSSIGSIPQSLKDIISAASQTYKTPPNLILGIMYGEGLFNPGRLNWTDQNVKNWATCQKVPNCNESGDDNFMGFNGSDFANITPHILPDLQKLDPTKKTLSQCNLLDAIYAEAYNLHASAAGGGPLAGKTCFGISLSSTFPGSCSWNNSQYESAIKVAENGYQPGCFTLENSCATGGGNAALCPGGGDTCETLSNRYANPSHNACVWDVGHGN